MSVLGLAAVCVRDPAQCEIALSVLSARGYSAARVEREGALASAQAGRLTLLDLHDGSVTAADLDMLGSSFCDPVARVVVTERHPSAEIESLVERTVVTFLPAPFNRDTLTHHLAMLEPWSGLVSRDRAMMGSLIQLVGLPTYRINRAGQFVERCGDASGPVGSWHEQAVGKFLGELLAKATVTYVEQLIERALQTQTVQTGEFSVDTGSIASHYRVRLVPCGETEVMAAIKDITGEKAAEQRLVTADRLSALGTLSAGIAHEINNPLTYVLIGIESVAKDLRRRDADVPLGGRAAVLIDRLDGAMQGARRVRKIVSDLRAFARADEDAEGRPIDIHRVLDTAASTADSQIRYWARLERDYGDDVAEVIGNPDRLAHLFVNLLLYSAKTMPEGDATNNFIRLRTRMGDGRVVVEVEDSGPPIPVADLERIFDPVYCGEGAGESSGLSLWMCRSLVAGHGGEISAHSGTRGKTIRVVLPAYTGAEDSVEGDEDVSLQVGRVLVIDDDEQVAHSLDILFEGSDLVILSSGKDAYERVAGGEDFDWIFCDLMMPDMSGMEFYERVRKLGTGIEERIVFMTGGAFTRRARQFIEQVPNACLSKPFLPRTVARVLRDRR